MTLLKKMISSIMVFGCICCLSITAAANDYIFAPVTNACHVIDCETDTVIKSIPYNDYIFTSIPSYDGSRLYLNAWHSLYVIDTKQMELIDTFAFSSELNKVTVLGGDISMNGEKLYLSCSITKKKQNIPKLNVLPPQLVVFDVKTKQISKSYEIPYCVTGVMTLRNDPKHLILTGLDIFKLNLDNGKIEKIEGILNPETGKEAKNMLVFWQNRSQNDPGIFVNPYYTETRMGHFMIDTNTGKVKDLHVKDIWFEYSNILSLDKKYIFGVMDELIKKDAATGETIKAVQLEVGTCYGLAQTSDGKKIYVGPGGADISVFDTETMELLNIIPLDGDGIALYRISM